MKTCCKTQIFNDIYYHNLHPTPKNYQKLHTVYIKCFIILVLSIMGKFRVVYM